MSQTVTVSGNRVFVVGSRTGRFSMGSTLVPQSAWTYIFDVTDEEKSHPYFHLYLRLADLFTVLYLDISESKGVMRLGLDGVKPEFWKRVFEKEMKQLEAEKGVKWAWRKGLPRPRNTKLFVQLTFPVSPSEANLFERLCALEYIETEGLHPQTFEDSSSGSKTYSSISTSAQKLRPTSVKKHTTACTGASRLPKSRFGKR